MIGQLLSNAYTFFSGTIKFFTPDFFQIYYTGFILFSLYTIIWLFSIKKKDVGLVNFLWGLGFIIQGLLYLNKSLDRSIFSFFTQKFSWEKLTFATIVIAHGIRLTAQFMVRDYEEGEDMRYSKLREKMGVHFSWLSFFTVFMPALVMNMTIGFVIYAFSNVSYTYINHIYYWIGISMMIFGGVFGALADLQKYYFLSARKNEGKVMDLGLWSLCRHPNYLGEMIFWWGAFLCNFSAGILWTIISPLCLNLMIFFITGIPQIEQYMQEQLGEKYADYQRRVPMIIPLPKFSLKGSAYETPKSEPMKSH